MQQELEARRKLAAKNILLVDKPEGISSFGMVAKIRGRLGRIMRGEELAEGALASETEEQLKQIGQRLRAEYLAKGAQLPKRMKVGHAGTLDPFASGLLIILIGQATKQAGSFLKLDKEYIAELELGKVSDTGDIEGRLVEKPVENFPERATVETVVQGFKGESWQTVPKYSAVKIQGQRAYRLARQGKEPEMPRRLIQVYEIEVLAYQYPKLQIRCKVSSGTYIRALGEDIGAALGTGAYLRRLRRTQIGPYIL